jgi:C-terminal processing protease CtpA/Prc
VLGTGSADEWRHIVFGAGYVTGVNAKSVTDDGGASDQKAFLDAGVPAVQFFSGPHLDYHRPTDDPEKLDYAGMVKVASFIKEFVEYLSARETAMTSDLKPAGAQPPAAAARPKPAGRRVSLGTIPDFTWEGEGLRVSGVTPDSPAAQAGLAEGDVVVELAGQPINDLRDLSTVLKTLAPGDKITLSWLRDGTRHDAEVVLKER